MRIESTSYRSLENKEYYTAVLVIQVSDSKLNDPPNFLTIFQEINQRV